MDRQTTEWRLDVERIWSAATLDYRAAEWLAADIATSSQDATLRPAAVLALPALRNAALENADPGTLDEARRLLGIMRDVLQSLDAAGFGQRAVAPKLLSPQAHHRKLLGLPLDRRLTPAEIHRAYKRAAKTAHPDGGGDAQKFLALSAAQDALMKE
jgi:DnaJ-domain-containing protein 1